MMLLSDSDNMEGEHSEIMKGSVQKLKTWPYDILDRLTEPIMI